MAPLRVRLGQAVREHRNAAGFSQEAFAAHIRVHRTSMSSIELGKFNVGLNTLERLARGLEMPAWGLLRIAEVGAGFAKTPRPGRGSRHVAPYGSETSTTRNDAAARRKVAEDRDR